MAMYYLETVWHNFFAVIERVDPTNDAPAYAYNEQYCRTQTAFHGIFWGQCLGWADPSASKKKMSRSVTPVIHTQESPPHKRFLVGCSSPFMRLAEHLTALRAWY